MVVQNGYFVNPETHGRASRTGRDGAAHRRDLPVSLAMGAWESVNSGRVGEIDPAGRGSR